MNTKRVILVDANPDRRAIWRAHILQIPFCQLLTDVGDMGGAAALVRELRPDFVLIGHELPDSGGIHLARRLSQEMPGLPILVLAAEARCEDVLQALRAGVRDFLIKPSPHELRAVLARLAHVAPAEPVGAGRVITVFSPKGGTGQTSLAANMAIGLHQETGLKVAVVDLNGRHGQLDLQLDVYPPCSWLEAAGKGLPWEQALHPHRSGITLVLASRGAESVPADAVQHLLQTLCRRYDYVVIDADHRAHPGTGRVLQASAAVVVPIRLDLGGLRAAQLAMQIVQEQQLPTERLRLVTLGAGSPAGLTATAVSEILKHPIANRLADDPVGSSAAIDRGVPYVLGDPDGPLAVGVRRLVRDLAGLTPVVPPAVRGLHGFRLWL
ncbi:MAG: response regulator, partial [Candidatus Sericytochromatia bacterium]|nr:response regulator [Candidatus Sericytochromatia bacterium]